jgi:hypothetical protein
MPVCLTICCAIRKLVTRGVTHTVPSPVMLLRSRGEIQGDSKVQKRGLLPRNEFPEKSVPPRIEKEGTDPETSDTLKLLTQTGC